MSDGLISLTFEGTSNNALYDMTIDIPEGKTMILKQARFEIIYTGTDLPRVVNVAIGNTVSTTYVIDNIAGRNYFKVPLEHNPFTIGADLTNISFTYPDLGYAVSGRINKNCQVTLLDKDYALLGGLVYYILQFQVI